jgi:hypothetical protein
MLLLLLPVGLVSFVALELVLWVLLSGPLLATGRAIARSRGLCLLTGCLAAVTVLVLASLLGQHKGVGETTGALLLGVAAMAVLTGLTAVTALLGRGALEMAGIAGSRAAEVLIGSALLGLMALFPVVGQVLAVYFALVGLGGALLALLRGAGSGK